MIVLLVHDRLRKTGNRPMFGKILKCLYNGAIPNVTEDTDMTIKSEMIQKYAASLTDEERCAGTIEKYLRDVRGFVVWLGERELTKVQTTLWKEYLLESHKPVTVNSMISALNGFLRFIGREDCRVRFLRIQRRLFRDTSRELTREDYDCLLETARQSGKKRIMLVMETICATGIRVSELRFITVDALRRGRAEVALKGMIRTILLPHKLCRKLLNYAKKQKIASGEVFLAGNGLSLSRKRIWTEMKALCRKAGVASTKVFPHNLRHLFARVFYQACRNIVQLADVLGHSSIETTRIYLISTGDEHARQIERLRLVS